MQRLQIDHRAGTFGPAVVEDPGRAVEQLALPLRDLIDMNIKLLRQVAQRLSPFSAARATFALKAGLWFRRVRFVICAPDAWRVSPQSGRKATYRLVQIS